MMSLSLATKACINKNHIAMKLFSIGIHKDMFSDLRSTDRCAYLNARCLAHGSVPWVVMSQILV